MQRILIVTKYRFIGDSILAVPSIRAASKAWPKASITLLTGGKAHELLNNCPYVDDVIEFDPYRPTDQGLRRYAQLLREVRSRKFDLALVLNRSFHSALIAFLGGARLRVGWAGFQGRDFLFQKLCRYHHDRSEVECYLDIVRSAYGADFDLFSDTCLSLWLTKEEQTLLPHPILGRPKLVAIQPGATHAAKRWPVERFAQLACEMLSTGLAAHIVLLGGPDEAGTAHDMLALMSPNARGKVINLVGQLSLRQSLSALSRVGLLVANDTAIRHAAVALQVPSVALFGPTSSAKWGNSNPPAQIVIDSPTGDMVDISVDDVMRVAGLALKHTTLSRSPGDIAVVA